MDRWMIRVKHPSIASKPHVGKRYRWLVFAALACMVGLYSLQVTHLHRSVKSSLEYPKSQVERPVLLDELLPDLAAAVPFHASYHYVLPEPEARLVAGLPRLTPQVRAPPFLYS